MRYIPLPALVLGALGLLPFALGALLTLLPPATIWTFGLTNSQPAGGVLLLARYGTIILCFMAGALWGFAAAGNRRPGWLELIVAVLPALWLVFSLAHVTIQDALWALALGFIALIPADMVFQRVGLAPPWWMALRIPLTIVVVACLAIGALA